MRGIVSALIGILLCVPPRSFAQEPIELAPTRDENPPVVNLSGDQPSLEEFTKIGEFSLTNQLGETVTNEDLAGHPYVASFIFTRCAGACPIMMLKIKEVHDRVKDTDVKFVSITVDPDNDSPEKLKQYGEVFGADPDRWIFLTGEQSELYSLIQHGFKVPVAENTGASRVPGYEYVHSLRLIHVDETGHVVGKYDSGSDEELLVLRQVLEGKRETPEQNRPIPSTATVALTADDAPGVTPPPPGEERIADVINPKRTAPDWVMRLPAVNATLNGLATVLLIAGFAAIKSGRPVLHKRLMLTTFYVSMAFLACYLLYHFALHQYTGESSRKFTGTGGIRTVYLTVLATHVVLAMAVPVLAAITIFRGLTEQWEKHRKIARVTFPIWLYVSVTGVIIYGMLYHWPI